ncbi:hypothetical protein BKA65DRAFT_488492 [Rhexocercosporidium sp. MPI-PUGE-AT-0058]|nr:hypothetical protein BKA65DRAFT_488492 [Rhexocercosporidium sp. MPI-PUGE-AT-0058]
MRIVIASVGIFFWLMTWAGNTIFLCVEYCPVWNSVAFPSDEIEIRHLDFGFDDPKDKLEQKVTVEERFEG